MLVSSFTEETSECMYQKTKAQQYFDKLQLFYKTISEDPITVSLDIIPYTGVVMFQDHKINFLHVRSYIHVIHTLLIWQVKQILLDVLMYFFFYNYMYLQ